MGGYLNAVLLFDKIDILIKIPEKTNKLLYSFNVNVLLTI